MDKLHPRKSQSSEKRLSTGASSTGTDLGRIQEEEPNEAAEEQAEDDDNDGQGPRKVFFNQPLPRDAIDESGHPLVHYKRNKIRTAKYTPLSFIPKNIWFQFHNIANVYFLFLIILTVSSDLRDRVCDADDLYRSLVSSVHLTQVSMLSP